MSEAKTQKAQMLNVECEKMNVHSTELEGRIRNLIVSCEKVECRKQKFECCINRSWILMLIAKNWIASANSNDKHTDCTKYHGKWNIEFWRKCNAIEYWSTEKVYKRQGWYRTKKLAIFAIYQNRGWFAPLDTLKNRHCLDSLPKQIELIQGLSWKSFHCRFTEIRQCEQYWFISGRSKLCLFNTFHSNRIKNMRISFLTFPLYKSQE